MPRTAKTDLPRTTKEAFRHWREAVMGYSRDEAGDHLGYTGRQVRNWEEGTSLVPPSVSLAMTAIYHRMEPWTRDA